MLRKAFLIFIVSVLILSFFPQAVFTSSLSAQLVLTSLVVFAAMTAHARYLPFGAHQVLNRLEAASLAIAMITFTLGQLLRGDEKVREALSVIILLVNIAFLIYGVVMLFVMFSKSILWKKIWEGRKGQIDEAPPAESNQAPESLELTTIEQG